LLLADGIYTGPGNCNVLVFNKSVDFISESGDPEACMVDCDGADFFVAYSGWDMGMPPYPPAGGRVEGIGITDAEAGVEASAEAGAGVRNCIISHCTEAGLHSIGVAGVGYGSVVAESCIFSSNPGSAILCGFRSSARATNCSFYGNGRALYVDEQGEAWVTGCTIASNSGAGGGVISGLWLSLVRINRSVIAFNSGNSVGCNSSTILVECSDIYGNGGDYVSCISGLNGIDGNFSADPEFCNLTNRDFGLREHSPCLPGNHPDGADCGLIGAFPANCDAPSTETGTWGAIKALYR
jgi:hypothetical protein